MTRATRCCSILLAAALTPFVAAQAQPQKPAEKTPQAQPAGKPGQLTEADLMKCMMDAAQTGPMHEHLAKLVGTWNGKCKMWMPGSAEPQTSECTTVFTSMIDGKFVRSETTGEMPGMGTFAGFGVYGFDNVSKKFQTTWCDNMGTGMVTGTGELSSDGKTMNWDLGYNCPVVKGPIKMRQVEHITGPDTMMLEMYGPNPLTGKEEKAMEIAYTRAAKTAEKGAAAGAKTAK